MNKRVLLHFSLYAWFAAVGESRDVRSDFREIESYACYYGEGMVDELGQRDAAIIEIRNQTPESIRKMQKEGTLVIGYISIGEDDELRVGDGRGPGGMDSGYFDRDGDDAPDKNPIWNSYYADSRQPAWREYFLERTSMMKEEYGVDGFFLDTVDTSELYRESSEAMASLIRELREQNPDSLIVLNRGFHLVDELAPEIDGVMFESFSASYDWSSGDYILLNSSAWDYGLNLWKDTLEPAMEDYGVVVLALDYAESPEAENLKIAMDRAKTFGFVPEVSTIYLDQIYEIDYEPQSDAQYLEVQSTPERISYELSTPMNGFPAGTVVEPSSSYPEYEVSVIVDGVADRSEFDWRRRAWASWEKDGEHSLQFRFPNPMEVEGMRIVWAWDNGVRHASRDFRIEVKKRGFDSEWQSVAEIDGNEEPENRIEIGSSDIVALRLVQEDGMGSSDRPNLMWIEQVELESLN